MADNDFRWVWDAVGPFVPPTLGAFIGLRYTATQSRRDQAVAWACSAAAGIYCGGALGEFYTLGNKTMGACMFLIAMFGSELFAAMLAAIKQWTADPVGTFRKYRNAIMGARDEA